MADSNNVRAFFERLAEDDEFREAVVEQPEQMLQEYGIEYAVEDVPSSVELPSKEDLRTRLDEYVERLGDEPVGYAIWMFIIQPPATSD